MKVRPKRVYKQTGSKAAKLRSPVKKIVAANTARPHKRRKQ